MKEFWAKSKNWQKSVFLGFIFGFLFVSYLFLVSDGYVFDQFQFLRFLIFPITVYSIFFGSNVIANFSELLNIFTILLILTWFGIIGLITGNFYEKTRKRIKSQPLQFFVVLILFLMFAFLIYMFDLLLISSRA